MPEYVELGLLETAQDPATFSGLAFDSLFAAEPDFDPTEGKVEARLIEAIALMASELSVLIGAVPSAIFRYFGRSILELASIDPSFASVNATVTMISTAGYTLPVGSAFGLRRTGDQLVAFLTVEDLVVPPGETVGTVSLVAIEVGAAASGLSGLMEPIDAFAFIQTIETAGQSTGGVDGEDDLAYQDRLRQELTTLADRLILPRDGEIYARRQPGVASALGIDLLDPVTGGTDVQKTITYALRDLAGEPVSSFTKLAVQTDLEAKREVNFRIFTIDADYNVIDVVLVATALPGFDAPTVQASSVTGAAAYLYPGTWGPSPDGPLGEWRQVTLVRYLEVAAALDRVSGLDYVSSLLIGLRQPATADAASDAFTATAHGLAAGQPVVFAGLVGGDGVTSATVYYAANITADTFKVAATAGGTVIDVTSDVTAGAVSGLGTADLQMTGYAPLPRSGLILSTVSGGS